MNSNTIIQWLKEHDLININGLHKKLQLPSKTIRLDGSRKIPDKYIKPIAEILAEYGFNSPAEQGNKTESKPKPKRSCPKYGANKKQNRLGFNLTDTLNDIHK